jgi:hypothetical protein
MCNLMFSSFTTTTSSSSTTVCYGPPFLPVSGYCMPISYFHYLKILLILIGPSFPYAFHPYHYFLGFILSVCPYHHNLNFINCTVPDPCNVPVSLICSYSPASLWAR